MKYSTSISERSSAKRTAYIARLIYRDEATGLRKEKSKSASSYAEARHALRELEDEFFSGGPSAIESDAMTCATRETFRSMRESDSQGEVSKRGSLLKPGEERIRGTQTISTTNNNRVNVMSPSDHNKTLVLLYSFLSLLFALPLVGSPWIIAKSVRHSEQMPIAIAIGFAFLLLDLLFLITALALYRKKPYARKLALVSAVLVLPICWRMGVYTWRFMHTEGAKKMYRGKVSARVAFYR